MKKFLFLLLLAIPTPLWGTIARDTLRPTANGVDLAADDNNTAGCAATDSNWFRVSAASLSDTVSFDLIVGVCNTGDGRECYALGNWTIDIDHLDTTRIRAQLRGTVALDSARLFYRWGADTVWTTRFAVTTSFAEYEFTSATDPRGNPWSTEALDSLEIGWDTKMGVVGRIWNTYIRLVVVYTERVAPPDIAASASRFYFSENVAAPVNVIFTTTWNDTLRAQPGNTNYRRKMVPDKTGFAETFTTRIDTSGTTGSPPGESHLLRSYVSDTLANQRISGTVNGQFRGSEESTALNGVLCFVLKVVSRDGTVVRGTLLAEQAPSHIGSGNEFTNPLSALTNRIVKSSVNVTPVTLTDLDIQQGDRLVWEQGFEDSTASTPSGGVNFGIRGDSTDLGENTTETQPRNPWGQFSRALAFAADCRNQDTLDVTGDGSEVQWFNAACSQVNLFANIDERNAHDVDATYVQNDFATGTCAVALGHFTSSCADFGSSFDTIDSVRMVFWPRSVAGTDSIQPYIKTTDSTLGAKRQTTTTYAYQEFTLDTPPGGGSWTDAKVDSLQIGWTTSTMAAASQGDVRVTAAYAVVFSSLSCPAASGDRRREFFLRNGSIEKPREEYAKKVPAFHFRRDGVLVQ